MSDLVRNAYASKIRLCGVLIILAALVFGFSASAIAQTQQGKPKNILDATTFNNVLGHCERGKAPFACIMLTNHYNAIAKSKGQYDDKRRHFASKACLMTPRQGEKLELDQDIVGLACRGAGEMLKSGIGGPKDLPTSGQYFKRSCHFDDMVGCAYLGEAYETGQGITKNKSLALATYKKSCSDKLPISCYRSIRMIFWDAIKDSNAPNNQQYATARQQSDITCNQKWAAQVSGCWYHGFFMAEARGGPADPAAALKAFYFTCENSKKENGLNACYSIASIRLDGPQNLRDKAEAKRLLTAGCTAKYQLSCDRLKMGV